MQMDSPPFPRGDTIIGYIDSATPDTGNTLNLLQQLEGMEYVFADVNWGSGGNATDEFCPARSNNQVRCRVVRNVSGGVLLPKRAVAPNTTDATGVNYAGQAGGYATLGSAILGIVDEFLPAAGVPNNYLFWCVIEGPSLVTTDSAGTTTITSGTPIVPGGTGNGTVVGYNTGVATDPNTLIQVYSTLGRCRQAVAAVSTDFLAHVKYPC